ncbi:MAG: hypothetical protein ASARMPRED_006688 [Alectoria sarmentosa]|nr:MAG: hypothetical protein ASARMPRED_006688 [Alectoria sarmentosa]
MFLRSSTILSSHFDNLDGYTQSRSCFWSLAGVVAGSVWLLMWRLWSFTIRPYLKPEDPKELPYWIPILGHAVSFFRNSDKLIERGLNYTKRTHEPFAIKVGGTKFYIVTEPQDVAEVYRNVTSLNWDGHLSQILINLGFKMQALDLAWHKPIDGESCYVHKNPNMLDFNDRAWMVFFGLPSIFSSEVTQARRKMTSTMTTFADLSETEREGQAWGIRQVLQAQETVGIDKESRACMLLLIYWAANSNEYNISFWLIAHLLFNERLLQEVGPEIEAAWKDNALDIKHLCANAPVLDGVFHESLRLNGGAMMSRKVLARTNIGRKVLQPGTNVLIPSRQLHMNEQVWGADCARFDAGRFVENKTLLRHSSYRPFGGGVSYCPGRVMAKEQVYAFVGILFHRFGMKLSQKDGIEFPRLDESMPSLGITGPVKGMDIVLDLKVRS